MEITTRTKQRRKAQKELVSFVNLSRTIHQYSIYFCIMYIKFCIHMYKINLYYLFAIFYLKCLKSISLNYRMLSNLFFYLLMISSSNKYLYYIEIK